MSIKIDITGIESDGERWYGQAVLSRGDETARGTWRGFTGSDMGELLDVEGEDEALCQFIDAHADEIESSITDMLGEPTADETGRRSMWAAVEQERAIHEARIGEAA